MLNARIVNNHPICPKCNTDKDLGDVRDYKSVSMNDKQYTLFTVHCYKCKNNVQYLSDVTMDGTTRLEVTSQIKSVGE